MTDNHWAITLYERYVALYGEPIEQPITATKPDSEPDLPPNTSPMNK